METRLKNTSLEQINNSLDRIALLYRVKADEINRMIIINTVVNEYPNYLFEDFNEAFNKHVVGKFSVDDDKPYGDLSTMFICRVLNGYTEYKRRNPDKPEPKPQLPIPEDTPKQAFDFIEKIFNETGKEPLLANWNLAFKHAEETNLITLTTDEKLMFQENVRFEIEQEMKYKRVRKLNGWIDLREILENKSLMAYECRKRILIKYFNDRVNK